VPGANASLSPAHVERADEAFRSSQTLLTQLEIPVETATAGVAAAHRLGIRTILNPAPAATLPPDVLSLVDVLTPNESEAERMTGRTVVSLEDAAAAVEHLLGLGPRAVALTMGASGVYVGSCDGLRTHVPAFPVQAIDSTGAGDVFNGALAVALSENRDLAGAAQFASAAAAISVTREGALHSAPQRREIENLLRTARR
jgi:ribokinase